MAALCGAVLSPGVARAAPATCGADAYAKPYQGVEPVSGRIPLLVALVGPDTPYREHWRDVYSLTADGRIRLTVFSVLTGTGEQDMGRFGRRTSMMLPRGPRFAAAPFVLDHPDHLWRSVFALGTDGRVYQTLNRSTRRNPGDGLWSWAPWSSLPTNVELASAPAAIDSPDGSETRVIARGKDGLLYESTYTRGSGSAWSSWTALPTLGNGRAFASSPAVLGSSDGSLASVFVTGSDGHVYQIVRSWSRSGRWGSWAKLPGGIEITSAPVALNAPDGGHVSVMATGWDGKVYQILFVRGPGSRWTSWQRIPSRQTFTSAPSILDSADGTLSEAYATATDGRVYRSVFQRGPGSRWGAWQAVRPTIDAASAPAAKVSLESRLSRDAIRSMLFGATDSVRAYFLAASFGKFTFDEALTTEWLTARDDEETGDVDESSFAVLHGATPSKNELYMKQIVELNPHFDFARFDTKKTDGGRRVPGRDGVVERDELAVLWVYPGSGGKYAGGAKPTAAGGLSRGLDLDGLVRLGSDESLHTFAHELGHFSLKLDDLYQDQSRGIVGVRTYSLMGSNAGSRLPLLDPWSRMKLGWLCPTVVQSNGRYFLDAAEADPFGALLVPGTGTDEYFMVENRWPTATSSDPAPPDRGLAIWHIDQARTTASGGWGRDVIRLEWAGRAGAERSALFDGSDPATSYDVTDDSGPASTRWEDGSDSNIEIRDISAAGPRMSMTIVVE